MSYRLMTFLAAAAMAGAMITPTPAAGSIRPCYSPDDRTDQVLEAFPDAVAHTVIGEGFDFMAPPLEIVNGDTIVWFERAGVSKVLLMVFTDGCFVGQKELDKVRVKALSVEQDS